MRTTASVLLLGAALAGRSLTAQDTKVATATASKAGAPTAADSTQAKPSGAADDGAKRAASKVGLAPTIEIQHQRPQDQRGLLIFEAPKNDGTPWNGFRMSFGAAFTQQFQGLGHRNAATPNVAAGVDANRLKEIGHGFNNAVANLYVNAQLAPGIRVAMTTYLSSRHHNETWVKDGYLQIDASPIDNPVLNAVMKYVTVKAGHFEVNYGDAHFRRTDNGQALHNPFVGNLILDAFTTEIGGEVYVQRNGLFVMGGVTGGEIRGNIESPAQRSPAYLAKAGFDRQMTKDLRVRLTGSMYTNGSSPANTLFAGDRAGSRYYLVLENTAATTAAQASSGLLNPGFRAKVRTFQVNPFVKVGGLEVFGVAERAEGRTAAETADREFTQYAGDVVYRFLDNDLYVAGRYNTVEGRLAGMRQDVNVNRSQFGAGWFITPLILLKGEWVNQKYNDFPTTDIRSGGRFRGFVVEGVVAF